MNLFSSINFASYRALTQSLYAESIALHNLLTNLTLLHVTSAGDKAGSLFSSE